MKRLALLVAALLFGLPTARGDTPASDDSLTRKLDAEIARLSSEITASPKQISLYSGRGDALFFRGRFKEAVADYESMVELDPSLDRSHWRRGIAYWYAGSFDRAAAQFERYHTFDDVDRENGIWRFLSQAKSRGLAHARKKLLDYRKTDRPPLGDVYEMFAAKIDSKELLARVASARVDDREREKRLFYAHLYIGLLDAIEGRSEAARLALEKAARNTWAPDAGFGPRYMWHVARVHLDTVERRAKHESSAGERGKEKASTERVREPAGKDGPR